MKKWLFRLASSPRFGGGHMIRSLQLAQAMSIQGKQENITIEILLDEDMGPWKEAVSNLNFSVLGAFQDVNNDYTGIWIDHYEPEIKALRDLGAPLVGMVDDPNTTHPYDISFSYCAFQNLNNNNHFSGFEYALIDPDYALIVANKSVSTRYTLCFGQSDSKQATRKIMEMLERHPDQLNLNVICGPTNKNRMSLRRFAKSSKNQVEIVDAPDNLQEILARTDVFISAGGVAVLEACAAGVPSLVLTVAKNQVPQVKALADLDAILYLGTIEAISSEVLYRNMAHINLDENWHRISFRGKSIIDGRGANRITQKLIHELGEQDG